MPRGRRHSSKPNVGMNDDASQVYPALNARAQVAEPRREVSGIRKDIRQRPFVADPHRVAVVEQANDVRFKERRIPLFREGIADRFDRNGDYGSAHGFLRSFFPGGRPSAERSLRQSFSGIHGWRRPDTPCPRSIPRTGASLIYRKKSS